MVEATTLSSLAGILRILKGLGELASKKQDTEFNAKVIELQQLVLELQAGLAQMQAENTALKADNESLKKSTEIEKSLVFENHVYWRKDNDKKDGPFCPSCWDVDRKLVRLHDRGERPGRNYYCNVHTMYFELFRSPTSDSAFLPYPYPEESR